MKVLTFDIEDWFHILDNESTRQPEQWEKFEDRCKAGVDSILDMLDRHACKATFFFLGWVVERHPEIVRRVVSEGHDIGSHSYAHQLVYEQTPTEFEEDLKRSLGLLGDAAGFSVDKYRAPGFSITAGNEWAFALLYRHGIRTDCSIFPAGRAHGGYQRHVPSQPFRIRFSDGELLEMPMNTRRVIGRDIVFSGGGYFRLLPIDLVDKWVREADYLMTYFHPRDFDSGQPVLKGLSPARRFKSYVGIAGAREKLERLLESYSWNTVASASELLGNEVTHVLEV